MSAALFNTDDLKWAAVRSNDESADGVFYYGVTSTGVVCYPSCSSRTPLRRNVVFFKDLDQALNSGLRKCRRCLR